MANRFIENLAVISKSVPSGGDKTCFSSFQSDLFFGFF